MHLKRTDSVPQKQSAVVSALLEMSTEEEIHDFVVSMCRSVWQLGREARKRKFAAKRVGQAEKNMSSSSSTKMTFTSKGMTRSSVTSQNVHKVDFDGTPAHLRTYFPCYGMEWFPLFPGSDSNNPFHSITWGLNEDLEILSCDSISGEVEKAMHRIGSRMTACIDELKTLSAVGETKSLLSVMTNLMKKAWAVPTYGHDLGSIMCNILRNSGGLQVVLDHCSTDDEDLQFKSAELLEQCLSTENRHFVVDHGLKQVVSVACKCNNFYQPHVGTGILAHLFKHSEGTCSNVISMGGLKAILYDCRSLDVNTLCHCAMALANLSLYGGPENQQQVIKQKGLVRLFPLAFHPNDNVKYYAFLAISSLVANKEIEAMILRSKTLDLIEPFVTSHSPEEFAKSHIAHIHGQSENWLLRLVNVLYSKREEARNLAAFHFAMEAGIKKKQGNARIFHKVGAVEALKEVANSQNRIASTFAIEALQLIGEKVPHKLLQQVLLWTFKDVTKLAKQGDTDFRTKAIQAFHNKPLPSRRYRPAVNKSKIIHQPRK